MQQHYVVGFAFSGNRVALINKNRPAWQKGLWNGIGGHVEPDEPPHRAMVREFEEETGARVGGWEKFVLMEFPEAVIHFYRADIFKDVMDRIGTRTDEKVLAVNMRYLDYFPMIPNLSWLIPLARYRDDYYECIYVKAENK